MTARRLNRYCFNALYRYCFIALFSSLSLLSACAVLPGKTTPTDESDFVAVPTTPSVEPKFYPVPITPTGPRSFAKDLVNAMGSPVGQCNADAQDTPHIEWTCAAYPYGLETFKESWGKLEASELFSTKYNYTAMSDWMYFAIDGEIDFFWKTYDLVDTQALVTYDPSEKGNELIIGINPDIGTNIAASPGSYKLTDDSITLPIQP